MISQRKEYITKIFLKKCTLQSITKDQLDFKFKWCENTFNVSQEKVKELKKIYTLDEYIKRIIPVIDKYFSIEDLQSLIEFYSSDIGKKMLDPLFLKEIGEVGNNLSTQIEREFMKHNHKI